jgi:hypothetical protein
MKTKTILKIALTAVLLICVYFLSSLMYGKYQDYKSKLETTNNELSVLRDDYALLVQTDIKKDVVIDSLSNLISQGKIDIGIEREKRKRMRDEMEAELDSMIESTDEENVEYFIATTQQEYPVQKYLDYYLISIESIKFANNAIVNLEYMEDENLSFIDEIQALNKLIFDFDLKVKEYDSKFINMNKMLNKKDAIIANKNIQIALNDSYNKKLRTQRNFVGISAILIAILK